MIIIEQSHKILNISHPGPLRFIEECVRTCYQSFERTTDDSAEKFVKMLIDRGHWTALEHVSMTVRFITNRGLSHELVRHRLCSFSQESSRYCNYGGKNIEFIKPVWGTDDFSYGLFYQAIIYAEIYYNDLLKLGWRPEQAREVLPNSLKTDIVCTANLREWRHIFELRTSKHAHPQMRALMLPLLAEAKTKIPVVFDDIEQN